MANVINPTSLLHIRKNRNNSTILNSFYSLNTQQRIQKTTFQADQISKCTISIHTQSSSPSNNYQKIHTQHNTTKGPCNSSVYNSKGIFRPILSPTNSGIYEKSFFAVKRKPSASPSPSPSPSPNAYRRRDFSLSRNNDSRHHSFSINNSSNNASFNRHDAQTERSRPSIFLPHPGLMTKCHKKKASMPFFHCEKINALTKHPIKVNKETYRKQSNNISTTLRNAISPNSNQSKKTITCHTSRVMTKKINKFPGHIQTTQTKYPKTKASFFFNKRKIDTFEHSTNENSITKKNTNPKEKTPINLKAKNAPNHQHIYSTFNGHYNNEDNSLNNTDRTTPKPLMLNKIHVSSSNHNFGALTSRAPISVNKSKPQDIKSKAKSKDYPKKDLEIKLNQKNPSHQTFSTSTNLSSKDLLHNSNNINGLSSPTANSHFSYDSLSNKSIIYSKTVHSIAKMTQVGFAGINKTKVNQDNLFIYSAQGNEYHFIGVCDGHGDKGDLISKYLSDALPYYLNKEINERLISVASASNNQIHKIIDNSFILANSKLSNDSSLDTHFCGSTCCSVLLSSEKLYCANVGDSRAILGKQTKDNRWESLQLSRDHKPTEQDEVKRIIRYGGRIDHHKNPDGSNAGPKRVWLKTEDIPGLAMTRSFGDQIASTVGVICEPEIKEVIFKDEDKFILLASDGLWEFVCNEECTEIISRNYLDNKNAESAVRELYKKAFRQWIEHDNTIDDITIILIFFC